MIKVPEKTSRYEKEPKPDKYVIPFAPELISFIKEQKKVRTYRFGLKYDYLEIGNKVKIQDYNNKKIVARAKITEKKQTIFGEIPVDIDGHESYRDKEHQREVFLGYYAYLNRRIRDDDVFLIIDFELI